MRRKSLLFTFLVSLVFTFNASALREILDTIPNDSLVITEAVVGNHATPYWWGYVELTNMSSQPLDLQQFFLRSTIQSQPYNPQPFEGNKWKANLSGILNPGESYLFVGRSDDGRTDELGELINPLGYANMYMLNIADMVGYHIYQALDSVGSRIANGNHRFGLFARYINGVTGSVDSARVDQFWFSGDFSATENEDQPPFITNHPIAGIVDDFVQRNYIWIRKATVKAGNIDFNTGRGDDLITSEWMPCPRQNVDQWSVMYTTVRSHGNTEELTLTPVSNEITVDNNAMKITMPLSTRRDSVFRSFTYGPNTAWELALGADSTKHFIQSDDSLFFYVYGNEMKTFKYGVELTGNASDVAEVGPIYYKVSNPPMHRESRYYNGYIFEYTVSQGLELDTIGNIPYATRTDTLKSYLDIPETAEVSFVWVDGVERPDVKYGDKMVVKNGSSTKEYKLAVDPYFPSMNANLTTVIFPGLQLFENPKTFFPTDTLVSFDPNVTQYVISLPVGTKVSPGIQVIPQNANSNVHIQRAKNLNGTVEEQTANVIVTAEDGEVSKTYSFIFSVEREKPQLVSEPFISDIGNGIGWGSGAHFQMFNPNDDALFLDDYVLFVIEGNSSWDAFKSTWAARDSNFNNNNKKVLRPGYFVMPDETGLPVFQFDYFQKTGVLESNQSYWITTDNGYPFVQAPNLYTDAGEVDPVALDLQNKVDYCTGKNWNNSTTANNRSGAYYARYLGLTYPYEDQNPGGNNWLFTDFRWNGHNGEVIGIMKIVNDSVKDGTKAMDGNFDEDYEVVDIIGGLGSVGTAQTFYQRGYWEYPENGADWPGNTIWHDEDTVVTLASTEFDAYNLFRKSWVYTGNPIDDASLGLGNAEEGTVIMPSEWQLYGFSQQANATDLWRRDWARPQGAARFKNHVMITNVHIPYITSKLYVVSEGLSANETIAGLAASTSVNQFLQNIIKPDTGMSVVVTNGGNVISGDDIISAGDIVTSTSADGKNSVVYTVQAIGGLDNNTTLTSTTYTVNGSVISGIPFGTTVADLISNVDAPSTALMAVVTGESKDEIVPIEVYSNDTLADGSAKIIDVVANDRYFIEVLAQDGVSVQYYSLEFEASELALYSEYFAIDQEKKVVDQLYAMSVATFGKLFYTTPGATITVLDKKGNVRVDGIIRYDDDVIIEKDGVSVRYYLEFREEVANRPESIKENSSVINNVYPNPTAGMFSVSGLENAVSLKVYTLEGKAVMTKQVSNTEMTLDLGQFSNGVYVLEIVNLDGTSSSQKVVKY